MPATDPDEVNNYDGFAQWTREDFTVSADRRAATGPSVSYDGPTTLGWRTALELADVLQAAGMWAGRGLLP